MKAWKKRTRGRPRRSANSGPRMQWAEPVAGSSTMPEPGPKQRLTTS